MDVLPDAPLSLWSDISGAYTPSDRLPGDRTVDVAVIGGGLSGLSTAYHLIQAMSSLKVAVLEAKSIGYGASGRNGSFAMTVIGLGFGVTGMLRGRQFLKEAHTYMEKAVDELDDFIQREDLDCDRVRPGFLRVATTQGYIKRLQHDIRLMKSLGFSGLDWIGAQETRARVNSARYLGALWEPRLVLVNPLKLLREEKRAISELGVQVYENTPVLEIHTGHPFRLITPTGVVAAEKLVFATNAYSHLFKQLYRKQVPAFTYMIATRPLSPEELGPIGWEGRQGIEDARNLIHYYRLTPDNRIVLGGGPVGLSFRSSLFKDDSPKAWQHLEAHLIFLFPHLKGIEITHRWGGPFSVTANLTPALGYSGDKRAVFNLGCVGHGVSMSYLNGQVLCSLLLDDNPDLLGCPFVNRSVIPWPPEPLRIMAASALRGYLQVEDWLYERKLPQHG
jgi:glycine/D-amino acid oxidase-like deaminating enzyme